MGVFQASFFRNFNWNFCFVLPSVSTPNRSFSELYQKSLQEKRRSEPPAGEAELTRPGSEAGIKPATLQLLHSLSLQDRPPHSLAEERTEFLRSHSDGLPADP